MIKSDYKKGVEEECPVIGLIKEHDDKVKPISFLDLECVRTARRKAPVLKGYYALLCCKRQRKTPGFDAA